MGSHRYADPAQRAAQVGLGDTAGDLHGHAPRPAAAHQLLHLRGVTWRGVTEDAHPRRGSGATQGRCGANHLAVALAGIDDPEHAEHRCGRDPATDRLRTARAQHRQGNDRPMCVHGAPAIHELVFVPRIGGPGAAGPHHPSVRRRPGAEPRAVGGLRDVVQRHRQVHPLRQRLHRGSSNGRVAREQPVGHMQVREGSVDQVRLAASGQGDRHPDILAVARRSRPSPKRSRGRRPGSGPDMQKSPPAAGTSA